jgi:hypothetical protein
MTGDKNASGGELRGEDGLRQELHDTNQRLARQRSELRHLKNAQGALKAENRELGNSQAALRAEIRELHRHALALEGELASALLALDAQDYDQARALLVRARGELARAVSNRDVESAEPVEDQA